MAGLAGDSQSLLSWDIRAAEIRDDRSLAAVDAAASLHPWSALQFAELCESDGVDGPNTNWQKVLIVEVGGFVSGFIVYSSVLDEGEILNIAVHPDYQGQGVARALLETALKDLRLNGVARCQLEVRVSNKAARSLYESLGFELDGVRKNYYPADIGREDALLLSKPLVESVEKRMPL